MKRIWDVSSWEETALGYSGDCHCFCTKAPSPSHMRQSVSPPDRETRLHSGPSHSRRVIRIQGTAAHTKGRAQSHCTFISSFARYEPLDAIIPNPRPVYRIPGTTAWDTAGIAYPRPRHTYTHPLLPTGKLGQYPGEQGELTSLSLPRPFCHKTTPSWLLRRAPQPVDMGTAVLAYQPAGQIFSASQQRGAAPLASPGRVLPV